MNHDTHRPTHARRRCGATRAGFTLVEILVVILIIGLLMAIMAPALALYKRRVMDNVSTVAFRQLNAAVLIYREEFQDFPPSQLPGYNRGDGVHDAVPWRGSQFLTLFLTGYGPDPDTRGEPAGRLDQDDGCDGYGFRVARRGKVYGPYLDAEKLHITGTYWYAELGVGGHEQSAPPFFVDAYDNPILYYRFDPDANMYHDDNGLEYYPQDSAGTHDAYPRAQFPTPGPAEGRADSGSLVGAINDYAKDQNNEYYRRDFLLISKGANKKWPNRYYWVNPGMVETSDDLTNFFLNR